jgi:hypothetical protein
MNDFSLQGQRDCTAEHNDILPALLGLTRVLDGVAERAKIEAPAGRSDRPSACAGIRDEDLVLALLGLLSIRGTLHRWLGQCRSRPLAKDAAPTEAIDIERDLLR